MTYIEIKCMKITAIALTALSFISWNAFGEEFRILAWNVESNRPSSAPVSDPVIIGRQLSEILATPATRSQLIALCEVDPKSFLLLKDSAAKGLNSNVDFVTSGSGGFGDSDSLMLIVESTRFAIEDAIELHRFAGIAANTNISDPNSSDFGALRARSPLAVKILDKASSKSFWVIVNHLARGEADLRTDQARMLVKWAAAHPEPIISAGDHNFDFEFHTQQGNEGFKAMIEGEVWQWLKPNPLIDTNWSDDRRVTDHRVDRYPDSILDFIFVANQAKDWKGKSTVVVRDGDFPDNDQTSDHRPIIADFNPAN